MIIFSFGTFIKFSEMPKEKMTEILEALGSLKQRVLLKVDAELQGVTLPSNVLTRSWIPQRDALAHPKVVLFINHGW